MKYLDEFRDRQAAQTLARAIAHETDGPLTLMEVCGGQTHSILKFGIDQLLPESIRLIHGPGCPVCVTDSTLIDQAIALARKPEVIFTSFGDMLRVPGSETDLLTVKSQGHDVRIVYSPLDCIEIAREHADREVVFFAVGFETTAPTTAMLVYQAKQSQVNNLSILSAHVRVPPAMEAILSSPQNQVQGFLAAGHVCTIMGMHEYDPIAERYRVPIVVTGFEPLDILQGIYQCVYQHRRNQAQVENAYGRVVRPEGNPNAQRLLQQVYQPVDRIWRGLGTLPESGLALREAYSAYDALQRFDVPIEENGESNGCISGEILTGHKTPHECPLFGGACTPEHPAGAPMVSSEGACAAYYRYRRHQPATVSEETP